jgi:hypothetical protein
MTDTEVVIDGGMIGGTRPGGAEVNGFEDESLPASAKCDFSGKLHSNISMDDSTKLAMLAN